MLMVGNFSGTKVSSQASLSSAHIPGRNLLAHHSGMPKLAITPIEAEEQRKNILARQKVLLQHVPAWLRRLRVTQRELAEHLGVSEGSVSKWFSGGEAIKAGRIVEIASFLKLEPTDLLAAPPGDRLAVPVADLLAAVEGLSAEEIGKIAEMARLIQGKRGP